MTYQKINDAEAAAVLKIIEKAVREAVEAVGLEGVRMLSMFLSNARADDCRAKRGAARCDPQGGWCTMIDQMSLRDYFAARFAAALMTATSADSDLPNLDYRREAGGPTLAERVAAIAYRLADAMLQAREKRTDIASTKREQCSAA